MGKITFNTFANWEAVNKYRVIKEDIELANFILNYLENNGESRCSDISENTCYSCQKISAMLRKLFALGYVKRREEQGKPFTLKNTPHRKTITIHGLKYVSDYVYEDLEITPTIAFFSLI